MICQLYKPCMTISRRKGELYVVEAQEAGGGWHPIGDAALTPADLPVVIGDPAYRGKGLGRRVLALLLQRARELGWAAARVRCVYTHNLRARRLFEGAGFRLVETTTSPSGEPCWRFEAQLEPAPSPWSDEAFVQGHSLAGLERAEKFTPAEVDWLIAALGARQGQRVLDLGCGIGRHARELARRGFRVVGIDLSPCLVAEAHRRAEQAAPLTGETQFRQLDMRELAYREEFDHAYCLYESGFGRLGGDRAHFGFVCRVREAIVPGGRFALAARNLYRWVVRGYETLDLTSGRVTWSSPTLEDESGRRYAFRETLRSFAPPEIRLLADLAGFSLRSLWGVPEMGIIRPRVRPDDLEIICVLEKQ